MMGQVLIFLVAFLTWCGFNWVPDNQHLLVGLAVAGVVTWLTWGLFAEPPWKNLIRRCVAFLFWYLPVLLKEVVMANLDVAQRVVRPRMPIHPGIVKANTTLTSELGLTFLANSITLTPGTLSVDVDKNKGLLYIHWIDVKGKDAETATQCVVERFEKILKRIFH